VHAFGGDPVRVDTQADLIALAMGVERGPHAPDQRARGLGPRQAIRVAEHAWMIDADDRAARKSDYPIAGISPTSHVCFGA
jgi:hypothetical protein